MTGPTIGVLSPLLESYYYAVLLEGVHATVTARGGRVLAIDTALRGGQRLPLHASPLSPRSVDGLLIVLDAVDDEAFQSLALRHFPFVSISRPVPGGRAPYVIADNTGGMRAAVAHLLAHGHRRIAYIGGPADNEDARERHETYRDTLREAGIEPDRALEAFGDWNEDSGTRAMADLLARGAKFTALAAANDLMAFGALTALEAHGVSVPGDLAMVGFDDAMLAGYQHPPLTTVRQPFYSLGARAADILLDWLDGRVPQPGPVYVPTELVLRQSCGCRPAWVGEER